MKSFGNNIRQLRESRNLPLRKVAAYLDIDQAILSKIERGHRKARRELVSKLARYFDVSEEDLLATWLSDKLMDEIGNDELAMQSLKMTEEKIARKHITKNDRETLINKISNYFKKDRRVSKAWIFGSFVRGDATANSDIDIMIEIPENSRFTLFDFADIQYRLQDIAKRRIDLVEKGAMKPFAWETTKNEMVLIYEG